MNWAMIFYSKRLPHRENLLHAFLRLSESKLISSEAHFSFKAKRQKSVLPKSRRTHKVMEKRF